jgi:CRISPR/Cas system Type II protein with McrA/HNH and RuvC-like nuclease domain
MGTVSRYINGYYALRYEVLERDKFTCQYCGASAPSVILEIDHVVPVVHGGADVAENLVTTCSACNKGKGDRLRLIDAPKHPTRRRPPRRLETLAESLYKEIAANGPRSAPDLAKILDRHRSAVSRAVNNDTRFVKQGLGAGGTVIFGIHP